MASERREKEQHKGEDERSEDRSAFKDLDGAKDRGDMMPGFLQVPTENLHNARLIASIGGESRPTASLQRAMCTGFVHKPSTKPGDAAQGHCRSQRDPIPQLWIGGDCGSGRQFQSAPATGKCCQAFPEAWWGKKKRK